MPQTPAPQSERGRRVSLPFAPPCADDGAAGYIDVYVNVI